MRRTDACNYVFALSVHEKLTEQSLFSCSRISRKRHARTGIVTPVAEYHGLHIYRRPPAARNIVHLPVGIGSRIIPAAEYRLDGFHQLCLRILREIHAHLFFVIFFKMRYELFHIVCTQLCIIFHAALCL